MIHGSVEPGFEAVGAEFRRNFAERGELGAACAIYRKGKKAVDLWGGCRDAKTRAPWEQETLVSVMSTIKGMAAMAVALPIPAASWTGMKRSRRIGPSLPRTVRKQ